MAKDLYQILGVSRSVSDKALKQAYKKLARKYHPDVNPGDKSAEDKFKKISAAYEILGDPEKRKLYDEFGEDAEKINYDPEEAQAYRQWKKQAEQTRSYQSRSSGSAADGLGFDLGDIFGDVFGGGPGAPFSRGAEMPRKGTDISTELRISFVEAARGDEREIRLTKPAACKTCSGTGQRTGTGPSACSTCGGTGRGQISQGPIPIQVPCSTCGGTGQKSGPPCQSCHGRGEQSETAHLTVSIPVGIQNGQQIRLKGQGGPGKQGGPPGDLFIEIHVSPHPVFRRNGNDLELDLPVTVREAMFGAEVNIPTLAGRVSLKIPPGTQNGHKLRLKEKGVAPKNGPAGDLYARVVVQVPDPKKDPKSAQKAADALESLYSDDLRAELQRGT